MNGARGILNRSPKPLPEFPAESEEREIQMTPAQIIALHNGHYPAFCEALRVHGDRRRDVLANIAVGIYNESCRDRWNDMANFWRRLKIERIERLRNSVGAKLRLPR